jgi:hypothetical protein
VKRLSVRLLLTDEQAARACKTLDVHPTELDGAALVRSGIVKLGSDCVLVGTVEDIPGRLGIEITDLAGGVCEIHWFDDEVAQGRAAVEALKRFERVRYVREVASAFDWPKPTAAVLEWALGAAHQIHAHHTKWDWDKDRLVCEIGACRVDACVEACAVLGITGG